ncbi:TPA: DUF167 domain-containing protein [Candidatus Dependentiae bacterium]|nr:MAG: hypothetical protein UW09_C0002G0016 [candidate division TM6 bacterium GW2011_GWF2_43_87]HBL98115.1 DUF167 domain-containing protein [Candidatus Dependentiae bacterium]
MKISIKVVPSSGKRLLTLDKQGRLKCYLNSPPEGGKANKELEEVVAEALSLPKRSVVLFQGFSSRNKVLDIEGVNSLEEVLKKLGLGEQQTIFNK